MCGVYAQFSLRKRSGIDRSKAIRALDVMRHRGPDAEGLISIDLPWASGLLGMARLRVVDQSDLRVPYNFRQTLGVILAYNGEIYNWKALREEIGDSVTWTTQCDAEVVAAAWRMWGMEALDKFNGMWGFVLVALHKGVVLVSRDRAGEKPLYFRLDDETISFASEAKALVDELTSLATTPDLAVFEATIDRDTPFDSVGAIGPGEYVLLQHEFDVQSPDVQPWWELPEPDPREMSLIELVDVITPLIVDSIKIRHEAEVPVAIQLSGGLDSAIIQAVVRSDRLYCVDFAEEGINNLSAAKLASQGRAVVPVTFTQSEMVAALSLIARHLDFPATWSACCQWFMNKRIAADRNVVVLSGEGADELFGGYARYRVLRALRLLCGSDIHLAGYEELAGRAAGAWDEVIARMLNRGGEESFVDALSFVRERFPRKPALPETAMARVDFYSTMQILLRMADRMTSAFSLEGRAPFLDYRLMELSTQIPEEFKVGSESKVVLRRVAARLGVHPSIVNESAKKGLAIPKSWSPDGTWDRGWFKEEMFAAWKAAFGLGDLEVLYGLEEQDAWFD